MYRIADCTNPRKKKVVHFNRLKRTPIGRVPEPAKGEDMVEGARNDILPVGPAPGNRNGNDPCGGQFGRGNGLDAIN